MILLTGYDDFEYAQEAIKNQVREFLLKPITRKELGKVLETVKKELNQKRESRRIQEELKAKLDQSFPLLRERFLYRLSKGRVDRDTLNSRKAFFGWVDLEGLYQILLIAFPGSMDDLERLSLSEFLKMQVGEYDRVFFNPDEDLALLLQDWDKASLEQRSSRLAEEAFKRFSASDSRMISIGSGEVVDRIEKIERSYAVALNGVEYSRIMGISHHFSVSEMRNREEVNPAEYNRLCNRIVQELKGGGRQPGMDALEELFQYLASHLVTEETLKAGAIRLFYLLTSFMKDLELISPADEVFPMDAESFSSLEGIRAYFTEMLDRIDKQIERRRNDMLLSRIDKARAIIESRFGDSRFSLQDICDELYLSTSQFSLLFKEGTGMTFVEYLTNCRISEAKNLLLSTDMKGYEVAEKVGYADPRYFSLLFKKQTGMTAMEYRRSRNA